MTNPIKELTNKEKLMWTVSLIVVTLSNVLSENVSMLTLASALIGVTAVLFGAKGNVWGQILISVFAVLYGIISWRFRYFGEMATYLGMTLPMALWAIYTWIKNPSEEDANVVKIAKLSSRQHIVVGISSIIVTYLFYRVLAYFDTPNIFFSTISIITSFFAAALTMLRSSYYALWYALNDLVLIILWVLAAMVNPIYVPMIFNFVVFFVNDMYGFYSWKKREKSTR